MKVTDRRMFTDDGELREEYRFLERQKEAARPATSASAEEPVGSAPAAPAAPADGDPAALEERLRSRLAGSDPPRRGPSAARHPSHGEAGGHGSPAEAPTGSVAADPVAREAPVRPRRKRPTARRPSHGEAGGYESPAGGSRPGPGFFDLVAMLAEPIAFLLGDAQLPDGQSAEDLPRARLQIDLLGVLDEKTRGNLSAEESAVLENLLARLRMRYVEKNRP